MKRKRYTKEFKKRAVELLQHLGSRSADEVAEELGVSQGRLFRWRCELGDEVGYPEKGVDAASNEQDEVERLRRRGRELEQETEFPKKGGRVFRAGDVVSRYEYIRAKKARYPVSRMYRWLGVSRSGYYDWATRGPIARARRNNELRALTRDIYEEHGGRYGSPRIHAELRARGHAVGRHRVVRLMRLEGLRAFQRKRFRHLEGSRGPTPAANVLNRQFDVRAPNKAWPATSRTSGPRKELLRRSAIGIAPSSQLRRSLRWRLVKRKTLRRPVGPAGR